MKKEKSKSRENFLDIFFSPTLQLWISFNSIYLFSQVWELFSYMRFFHIGEKHE
jgi:hypothetical protein